MDLPLLSADVQHTFTENLVTKAPSLHFWNPCYSALATASSLAGLGKQPLPPALTASLHSASVPWSTVSGVSACLFQLNSGLDIEVSSNPISKSSKYFIFHVISYLRLCVKSPLVFYDDLSGFLPALNTTVPAFLWVSRKVLWLLSSEL